MYYALIGLGFFLSFIKRTKYSYLTFFIILLLVSVFRFGVGPDYFSYNYLFAILNDGVVSEYLFGRGTQEIGFRIFGAFFKSLGLNFHHYIAFFAVLNLVYILKICSKYSMNPTLSLLLYYCFYYFVWTFSGLRQGLTLAIGVYYLLECIEKRNTLKIFVVTGLLSLIHVSSFILIVLYYLAKFNFSRNKLLIFSIGAIVIGMLPLGSIFIKFDWIPIIARASSYFPSSVGIINIFDFKSLSRIVFLAIALFYYNDYSKTSKISKKIINLYVLSLILYFMLQFSELLAARLSLYGKMLEIVILVNIFYLYKDEINKYAYILLLSIMCLLYFNKELKNMENLSGLQSSTILVPYTNVINKDNYNFDNRYKGYLEDYEAAQDSAEPDKGIPQNF